jgi:membrane-associated phospholipid phosphatase
MRAHVLLYALLLIARVAGAQAGSTDIPYFAARMRSFEEQPVAVVAPGVAAAKERGNGSRTWHAEWIVPAAGVAYGTVARFNGTPLRRFDRYVAGKVAAGVHRKYKLDDYLQYAPGVAAFGLDFVPGVAARHDFRDRTLIMASSYLCMGAIVLTMKHAIPVVRPRGSGEDSFPSGHTAMAFTGAHVLFREYGAARPWLGIGGYAAATATGVLRVINRAHWVSDVVAGAGIGILSAELGYRLLPVWQSVFGITGGGTMLSIVPSVSLRSVGAGMVCVF